MNDTDTITRAVRTVCKAAAVGLVLIGPSDALADHSGGKSMPRAIQLIESDGELLRLPRPVASVLISDPGQADVQLVSDQAVFVFAKARGRTRLILLDASSSVIGEIPIFVGRSIASLEASRGS